MIRDANESRLRQAYGDLGFPAWRGTGSFHKSWPGTTSKSPARPRSFLADHTSRVFTVRKRCRPIDDFLQLRSTYQKTASSLHGNVYFPQVHQNTIDAH